MTLDDLITALEKAEGADRELDLAICIVTNDRPDWLRGDGRSLVKSGGDYGDAHVSAGRWGPGFTPPRYTASLDAIVELIERVLPGAYGKLGFGNPPVYAQLFACNAFVPSDLQAEAPTPALAMCLLLARALKLKEDADGNK